MILKFPNLSYFRKSELMQSHEITLCTLAKKLVELCGLPAH